MNQLLLHIAGTDLPLLDYCTQQDIVEAYSPIAHGEALKNPAITAMAEKYGVSVPQLCIRYVLQLGAVALPKTANPAICAPTPPWTLPSPRRTWRRCGAWST